MVEPRPRQRNAWLGTAGGKQAAKHLKGRCRITESEHGLVTDPLDGWRKPAERLPNEFFEALQDCYCRRVSIDISYRTETRQVDERNGREVRFEVPAVTFVCMANCVGPKDVGQASKSRCPTPAVTRTQGERVDVGR